MSQDEQVFQVKRVLWVEDNPDNRAEKLFSSEETKNVRSMDEAIAEFSCDRLYQYDTIVLDIDFTDGMKESDDVIKNLKEKVYLSKDQSNKKFVIDNGGYLLFLYLMERGYPADNIAFLTGNPGMIDQLRAFNKKCIAEMSKEEIADNIIKEWKASRDETGEVNLKIFGEKFNQMPISTKYKGGNFYNDCALKLIDSDFEGVKALVAEVPTDTPVETVENTGDKIIFRFHDANLKVPNFYSKNENDIKGHNQSDARDWLKEQRSSDNLCRWLLLDAGDFIENYFQKNTGMMNRQVIDDILQRSNTETENGGIRNAFRQMYFVFNGLHTFENDGRRSQVSENGGRRFQAISAMLIPYEATPRSAGDQMDSPLDDKKIRRMCAFCLKQARNYCAHGQMGSELSKRATLFLLMVSVTVILNRDQREEHSDWYLRVKSEIENNSQRRNSVGTDSRRKILDLMNDLINRGKINPDFESSSEATPRKILYAMGRNDEMDKSRQSRRTKRENYYIYTLASYVLGWFKYQSLDDIENMCDQPVACVYEVAQDIVDIYEYPEQPSN